MAQPPPARARRGGVAGSSSRPMPAVGCFLRKSEARPKPSGRGAERPRPGEQRREVSLHRGAAARHGQVRNLLSSRVTAGPARGDADREGGGFGRGERGIYLTIYRRSFRRMKYLCKEREE